ncbi:MAG: hypothetical protein IT434_17660 [Phycisphaerales bacterium]|nr:hypothetical protein [Phycisphaerales bacterium]
MIKPLRKRHLQTWIAIAVLLPAGIIFSWLVIPNHAPVKIVKASAIELLPIVQAKKETNQYCISIRSTADKTSWQLEWKNKLALKVPSAVIYKAPLNPPQGGTFGSFKPESAELIGRIEARGDYLFSLRMDSIQNKELNLVVYDFIHEKIIDKINFNNPSPDGEVRRGP